MNESLPAADDPVWSDLPDDVLTIEDGNDVVGFAFSPDANEQVALNELNMFLATIEMPPLPDQTE